MEEKHKSKFFKLIIYLTIILFLFVYVISMTGFYDYKLSNKTILTNDAIKKFEDDVKNGEEVDIKDYINVNDINYENKVSKIGYDISKLIDDIANKGVKFLLKIIKTLFS